MSARPSLVSRRPSWQSATCGPGCRQIRAVPVGGNRAITIDVHDESFHEGVAWGRGRDHGFDLGQRDGTAWTLLALTPRLRLEGQIITTGPLVVDLWSASISVHGVTVSVTPTEMAILQHLARYLGRVCSREALCEAVWPDGMGHRHWRNRLIGDRHHTLEVHVNRLRPLLGDAARLLKTKTGLGYVLLDEPAEVQP